MYIPGHFEVTDSDEIFAFVAANAFGQLISKVDGRFFSTHIPFLLSADRTKLLGHMARPNPQHLELDNQQVLVTFQGPHDYISPAWYASPGVPTWNYQAVHIYGLCKVFDEPEQLKAVVESLTTTYESSFDTPWLPDYRPAMLNVIIGFEISIEETQCKFKLNQNRSAQDRERVAVQLEKLGSHRLAQAMRKI